MVWIVCINYQSFECNYLKYLSVLYLLTNKEYKLEEEIVITISWI